MAQASSIPQPTAAASRSALHVVLFGMPEAGKSSLLGALVQAAQTQEHILGGRLIDRSQRLLELQRRLYEDRPRETLEEVVPFPISLEPFTAQPDQTAAGATDAVLVDCDGRVASKLLAGEELLRAPGKQALGREVLAADTLILA